MKGSPNKNRKKVETIHVDNNPIKADDTIGGILIIGLIIVFFLAACF